jgi:hypothetical protein
VDKRDEECCKQTPDNKASCLCVRACVCMYVGGWVCVCARKSEREKMNEKKEAVPEKKV